MVEAKLKTARFDTLFFKYEEEWVGLTMGRCVVVFAPTLSDAVNKLREVICQHLNSDRVHDVTPFSRLNSPLPYFYELFQKAETYSSALERSDGIYKGTIMINWYV